jgi:hypothetical protein
MLRGFGLAQIERDRCCDAAGGLDLGNDLIERGLVARAQHHAGALRGEALRNSASDAPAGTGHD